MNCKWTTICRGDRKIYLDVPASGLEGIESATVVAKTPDGIKAPATIYPKLGDKPDSKNGINLEGQQGFVVVLPDLLIPKIAMTLRFHKEQKTITLQKTLHFKSLKWQSRINYRIRPKKCMDIRDFDQISKWDRISMEFHEILLAGESNLLRGTVRAPYRPGSSMSVSCTTARLEPIELEAITMGESVNSLLSPDGAPMIEVQYSVRIPAEPQTLVFNVKNTQNPELDNFEVFSKERYQHLLLLAQKIATHAQMDSAYPLWFENNKASLDTLAKQASTYLDYRPEFSVIVPLYNTPLPFFNEMLESVKRQSYGRWQLVLVNASRENKALTEAAQTAARADRRIELVELDSNLGISENTNRGIERSSGDFICFFDHDDTLEPNLLFEYAQAVNEKPDTDVLYCDEDKMMPDGTLAQPFFKPDFSIDLLRNNNYICHMLAIRRSLYSELCPNTSEFDGAQDHNLTLQASEKARRIHHIPKVMYHWRISETSTAADANSKPYATQAGIKAVEDHLNRLGIQAKVEQSRRPFTYKVLYEVPQDEPLVSIIIPSKDHTDLLDQCLRSIFEKTTYRNFEVIIVENNSTDPRTFDYYETAANRHPKNLRIIYWEAEFNFSKLMNFGASRAKGEYLLLLNNDTEVISPEWIERLLGIASRKDVGVVGARLYYPDDTIQHAGVCVTGSAAGHLGRGLFKGNWGYFALHDAEQNLSAVTAACMMTKREVFERTGGWTEELSVAFNDIDFCLKAREQGYLVVYTPEVELYHYESISRGYEDNLEKKVRFHKEVAYMNYRWADYYVKGDPYINPNITKEEPFNCYYHL